MVNWLDATACKRCDAPLPTRGTARQTAPSQQFRPYVPEPEPEEPIVRDDGLAWASLMLGLGGFLLFGLSSFIGLLCGLTALWRARRNPLAYGGQRFAVAGIVASSLSALLLCGGLWWFVSGKIAEKQAAAKGKPVTWRELLK
jgi:hypothetical protein